MLQEKLGDVEVITDDENEYNVKLESNQSVEENSLQEILEEESEPSTEQDLVGVTQVAYIDPTPEPADENPENITLPMETDHINKEACTLVTQMQMKKEEGVIELDGNEAEDNDEDPNSSKNSIFIMDNGEQHMMEDDSQTMMEDQDLEAIAEAVKATLSSHPGRIGKYIRSNYKY